MYKVSKWYYCRDDKIALKKKRFANSTKDPFYNGTLERPLGNGFGLLVRANGEVLVGLNGLLLHEHELIEKYVDTFGLDYYTEENDYELDLKKEEEDDNDRDGNDAEADY